MKPEVIVPVQMTLFARVIVRVYAPQTMTSVCGANMYALVAPMQPTVTTLFETGESVDLIIHVPRVARKNTDGIITTYHRLFHTT